MTNNLFKWLGMALILGLTTLSVTATCMASSQYGPRHAPIPYQAVEIEIISDQGDTFSIYPVTRRHLKNEYRAYVEAIDGENYSIRIRNHSNQRLGLVIAVDGRNIISGKKSKLKHNERMYIVGPYETQTHAGWRTSSKDIHRFYFTQAEDSYAEAFEDDSAMGVIAVAVYEEKRAFITHRKGTDMTRPSMESKSKRSANSAGKESSVLADQAEQEAGTGFGEHQTSHVRVVQFNSKRSPFMKSFYKYEWRETLCQKNIIPCEHHHPHKKNRFWPHDDYEVGYAPHPPRH